MDDNGRQVTTADLRKWGRTYAQRDQLVRGAHDADIPIKEIARETGLAKTTVQRIIRKGDTGAS